MENEQLETDLLSALSNGEFVLYYQPRASCVTGHIVGVEALIRWQHPQRGLVMPGGFLPSLEKTGLIVPVGEWVLRTACQQARAWQIANLGNVSAAVNLSARQLYSAGLFKLVKSLLDESGLEPAYLELELTESALMENSEHAIDTLSRLRDIGVSIVVDDFGTGHSSLSFLKRFPLAAVMIDQTFVRDICANPDDALITRAVISMAHSLKLEVIAEGVETEAQLGVLIASRCDMIQGYFFSRPVGGDAVAEMLREKRQLASRHFTDGSNVRTLLLVDDEENILNSLKRLLRGSGYRILTASSGTQGLQALGENRVDVIISDQRMPEMTGVEFLRRVKDIHPDSVRIVLSGYTELQSVTSAINEGAIYKFLTKPWDDELLRANIEEAFRRKEMADEHRHLTDRLISTNAELGRAEHELRKLLAEKSQQASRNEVALGVFQEVLQNLPWPLIGIDEDGMVAASNADAEALFPQGLLGRTVGECLPEPLRAWLGLDETAGYLRCELNGRAYQAVRRTMGSGSRASGTLVILSPEPRTQ
jgi:EAL domain-containing protein (putative c-di-GMP-specific phosphodiesterase class I)/FixJ family two-component response regulator